MIVLTPALSNVVIKYKSFNRFVREAIKMIVTENVL